MNANDHQGLHGEGFIYALACAAGLTTTKMNLDRDGVDWQIATSGPWGTLRSPRLECQVKSKSTPDVRNDHYLVRIPVKNYNKLAGAGFQVPRFLFTVVVPAEASHYARCEHDAMTLGTAGYWLSMTDLPLAPTGPDDPKSVVVDVPRQNLLTTEALQALIIGDLEGATT
ncbi:MAG: DUF4365 domain-containing protein [Actinomycetota bacterium]|nr:DUF4365 domain-containing protein [Actinomycetota bacterium]